MIVIHKLGKRIIKAQVKTQTDNHSIRRKQLLVEKILDCVFAKVECECQIIG